MPEMMEILCTVSEVNRRAASVQSLTDKIRAMSEESLNNFDAALLSMNLEIAADALKTVQEMAAYLSRPVVETSRLWKNGSGQYETTNGYCFCEGSAIEVLVPNKCSIDGSSHWERTRLRHDGKDYYLAGYPDLPLVGMAVRVRMGDQPYGITQTGNFEGKNIPNLLSQPEFDREPERMAALRAKVYAYRLERTSLRRDDKVLTAWNGLALAALARAGLVLDEIRYLDAARRTAGFLTKKLTSPNDRLLARWRDGDAAHPGKLDDYVFFIYGLLKLYGSTFDTAYFTRAVELANFLLELFFDQEHGGFYPYASKRPRRILCNFCHWCLNSTNLHKSFRGLTSDGEQLLTRTKEAYDGAMPSGNSVAALVLSRLSRLTGEKQWRETVDLQLSWLAGAVRGYPAGHGFAMLTFLEVLWPTAELVVTAQKTPEEFQIFLQGNSYWNLMVLLKTPENADALAALAPFTKDYPIPAQGARYYLCQGGACAQPVDSISELEILLRSMSEPES